MLDALLKILERDLEKLRQEIEAYPDEESVWSVLPGTSNSAGNLCLHLAGNLQHFIGAVLGGSGYLRDREAEFSTRYLPKDRLLKEVDAARSEVVSTLSGLDPDQLAERYPVEVFGHPMTVEYFLIHLTAHLNYHLGQVNYHRRLLAGSLH
jgi:uncharacterized damage-inducible protein DinB